MCSLGFVPGDAEPVGEPEGLHPVEEPEVDHLGSFDAGSELTLSVGNIPDPGCGGGMDVETTLFEGLDQERVSAHVGQHPQFDL